MYVLDEGIFIIVYLFIYIYVCEWKFCWKYFNLIIIIYFLFWYENNVVILFKNIDFIIYNENIVI